MKNLTILVADDEDMVLEVAKAMLDYIGCNVILAQNGEETLRIFQERKEDIDFIIMDISMPDLDGFTCLDRIREESNVPVVMSTGLSQNIEEEMLVKHKAQGILPKPFSLDYLKDMIREFIDT